MTQIQVLGDACRGQVSAQQTPARVSPCTAYNSQGLPSVNRCRVQRAVHVQESISKP